MHYFIFELRWKVSEWFFSLRAEIRINWQRVCCAWRRWRCERLTDFIVVWVMVLEFYFFYSAGQNHNSNRSIQNNLLIIEIRRCLIWEGRSNFLINCQHSNNHKLVGIRLSESMAQSLLTRRFHTAATLKIVWSFGKFGNQWQWDRFKIRRIHALIVHSANNIHSIISNEMKWNLYYNLCYLICTINLIYLLNSLLNIVSKYNFCSQIVE